MEDIEALIERLAAAVDASSDKVSLIATIRKRFAIPDVPLPESLASLNDGEVIGLFVQLREYRRTRSSEFDDLDGKLSVGLDRLSGDLLRRMNKSGVSTLKLKGTGTAYISETDKVSCADWVVFNDFALQQIKDKLAKDQDPTEVFNFFEKRLKKEAVMEYMAANNEPPPAVNVVKSLTVNVRKS